MILSDGKGGVRSAEGKQVCDVLSKWYVKGEVLREG